MPDDDFNRRLDAVVRCGVNDIANDLKIRLTRAQRVRLSATVEALLHRWMQNEQEMWSLTDEDDDADDETELDGPMAGSA
jgi:hypothetical protein